MQMNVISSTQRKPVVAAEINDQGASALSNTPAKILFVGQMSPQGTATPNAPTEAITNPGQAESLFGAGSMLHRMLRAALESDKRSYFYGLPIADPASGSDFAEGGYSLSGTATAGNTEYPYLGADRTGGRVAVAIQRLDDAEDVAQAVKNAVNTYGVELASGSLTAGAWYEITAVDDADFMASADTDGSNVAGQVFRASASPSVTLSAANKVRPVSNALGVVAYVLDSDGERHKVKFIAKNRGTLGNDFPIKRNLRGNEGGESTTPGLVWTLTPMSGGTGQPDLSTALASVEGKKYDAICLPYTDADNTELVEDLMDGQWFPTAAQYGHVFMAKQGSFGSMSSWGNAQNGKHLSVWANYGQLADPPVVAAACGAVVAAELNTHPARPVSNLRVKALYLPPESERFTPEEMNLLYYDGISPLEVTADGGVKTDRVITCYQVTDDGTETDAWLDVNVPASLATFNKTMTSTLDAAYPRSILVSDNTPIGEDPQGILVRPLDIRNTILSAYMPLVEDGICQDVEHFAQTLVVEIDADDPNRVNIFCEPTLAGQLFVLALQNRFKKAA